MVRLIRRRTLRYAALTLAVLGLITASYLSTFAESSLTGEEEITAYWTLAPAELTVGDVFDLTLTVTHPSGTQALLPELENEWGEFELRSQSPVTAVEQEDGTLRTQQTIAATLFTPGEYVIPPLPITISDVNGAVQEVVPDATTVTVASVLTGEEVGLRDIKPQAELLQATSLFPFVAASIIGLAALAIGGWLSWRRRDRRVVSLTPLEQAKADLARIDDMDFVAQGNLALHYLLVTETLRRYVQASYASVPALDLTTSELQHALARTTIDPSLTAELFELLRDADLVKFAKLTPTAAAAHNFSAQVGALIEKLDAAAARQAAAIAVQERAGRRPQPAANGA